MLMKKDKGQTKKKNYLDRMLYHISSCMLPVIPVLVAGGLLKLGVLLLGYTPLIQAFPDTKVILEAISNAPFYFLPLIVAYTAGKHFEADVVSAMAAAGALLLPNFIKLMEQENSVLFMGIPVYRMTYAYTVFPIIVLIYLMSVFERALEKWLKGVLRDIFLRFLLILITALAGMLVVGPLVDVVSQGALAGISWLQINIPVLAWAIFGATAPLQIMVGAHWVFVSLVIQNLGAFGEESGFMVGYFMLTMSLMAVTLATMLNSKEKEKRSSVLAVLITVTFTGTTEPVLYGICLTDKIALLAAVAGGAAGGIYQGLVTIHTYVYAFPTVFSILIFQSDKDPGNLIEAAVAGVISFSVALFVMLLGHRKNNIFVRKA
jgi:phosphotransferase system  glucose/maltose/N-acetylglucosamine-specific IIC component